MVHNKINSTNKKDVWALETKKAAEPLGIGKVGFVFLRFHQFYFQFLALKTATFQRTKELLIKSWILIIVQARISIV